MGHGVSPWKCTSLCLDGAHPPFCKSSQICKCCSSTPELSLFRYRILGWNYFPSDYQRHFSLSSSFHCCYKIQCHSDFWSFVWDLTFPPANSQDLLFVSKVQKFHANVLCCESIFIYCGDHFWSGNTPSSSGQVSWITLQMISLDIGPPTPVLTVILFYTLQRKTSRLLPRWRKTAGDLTASEKGFQPILI